MSKKGYYQDDKQTEKTFLEYLHKKASVNDYVKAVHKDIESKMKRMAESVKEKATQKA